MLQRTHLVQLGRASFKKDPETGKQKDPERNVFVHVQFDPDSLDDVRRVFESMAYICDPLQEKVGHDYST